MHDFAKQYLKYSYYQDLMGISLKLKPFETSETDQNLSFQKMVEAFKELEVVFASLACSLSSLTAHSPQHTRTHRSTT